MAKQTKKKIKKAAAAAQNQTLDTLLAEASAALDAFSTNRSTIVDDARTSGGPANVDQVLDNWDTLRDAYYELVNAKLDGNHNRYQGLIAEANTVTTQLTNAIGSLKTAVAFINAAAAFISIIGQILIVLAL